MSSRVAYVEPSGKVRVMPPTWRVADPDTWIDPQGPWRFRPSTGHYLEGPFVSSPPWILSYPWSAGELESIRRAQNAGWSDYVLSGAAVRETAQGVGEVVGRAAGGAVAGAADAVQGAVRRSPWGTVAVAGGLLGLGLALAFRRR